MQDFTNNFIEAIKYKPELANNYTPTSEALEISKQRIQEKINQKPGFYRMKGELI